MKKIVFLGLLTLTLITPGVLFAQAAGAPGAIAAASTPTSLSQQDMEAMIRPLLEKYASNSPDVNVRVWSMVLLTNIDKIEQDRLFSIPLLVQQMSSKDESVRLVAMDTIRQTMDLDDDQWRGIMAPIILNLVKTAKYPEVKSRAIQALGKLQKMGKEQLGTLPLLFELAQDDNAEVRRTAGETIDEMLGEIGGAGGGGLVPR